MAETVSVRRGDTLTGMLKSRRGLADRDIYSWLRMLRELNPHIGDLNRIYPGETVLIPESLMESVSDSAVWENAFSGIPRSLESPHNGNTQLFFAPAGTSVDRIAQGLFDSGPYKNLPLSAKRAILIHNNPDLTQCLDTNRVPANTLVDITPLRLSKFDKTYWQGERPMYLSYLQDMAPLTREMFQQTGPEKSYLLSGAIKALAEAGASVGLDGLVTGTVSGVAVAGDLTLARINGLARQIYDDAARQIGRKAAASLTKANLAKMARFIKAHSAYDELMVQLEKVPKYLLPMSRAKLVQPAAANVDSQALARYFSKEYFQAFRRWPSGRYMGSIARQLNGRINCFRGVGRLATWYVPAMIGLYNVYEAPPETRVRTLFEEGFGIVGGWAGTELGAMAGMGIVLILGLGPLGLFVTVFICASVGGMSGNALFKWGGGKLYDAGVEFGDHIYHSADEIIRGHN